MILFCSLGCVTYCQNINIFYRAIKSFYSYIQAYNFTYRLIILHEVIIYQFWHQNFDKKIYFVMENLVEKFSLNRATRIFWLADFCKTLKISPSHSPTVAEWGKKIVKLKIIRGVRLICLKFVIKYFLRSRPSWKFLRPRVGLLMLFFGLEAKKTCTSRRTTFPNNLIAILYILNRNPCIHWKEKKLFP